MVPLFPPSASYAAAETAESIVSVRSLPFPFLTALYTPSTFYSIAACSAAAMLLFQTCLNIFGITDILPLTGVTLPFVSQGGSSMVCSWALFAFIKAADVRTYPKVFKTA